MVIIWLVCSLFFSLFVLFRKDCQSLAPQFRSHLNNKRLYCFVIFIEQDLSARSRQINVTAHHLTTRALFDSFPEVVELILTFKNWTVREMILVLFYLEIRKRSEIIYLGMTESDQANRTS